MALIDKKSLYDLVPGDGPTGQMESLQGPQFANPEQYTPSLHEVGLAGIYQSSVHSGEQYAMNNYDLDGLQGPQFANPVQYTPSLHEDGLAGIYQSSVHNLNYGPMGQDLNGEQGPQFANPEQYTPSLHEDALAGIYNSSVHGLNYTMTLYDLDGVKPENTYLGNLPEGLSTLIG